MVPSVAACFVAETTLAAAESSAAAAAMSAVGEAVLGGWIPVSVEPEVVPEACDLELDLEFSIACEASAESACALVAAYFGRR